MKKLLFICSSKPSYNAAAEEYLDAALACAAMSFDVCICFTGAGLEHLDKNSTPPSIKTKLEMTPLYDIETVAVESQLNEEEQVGINFKTVSQAKYTQLINSYDHVIHL